MPLFKKSILGVTALAALLAAPLALTSSSAEAAYCRPGWHATASGLCKRTVYYRPHHHRHHHRLRRHIVRYYEDAPVYDPVPVYQPPMVVPLFGWGWGGGYHHHYWRR